MVQSVMSPFYLVRPLLDPSDILAWCRSVDLQIEQPDRLHVTVAYSRAPLRWQGIPAIGRDLIVMGQDRALALLDGGALALEFDCHELVERHEQLRRLGASWDYPAFRPHLTLARGCLVAPSVQPFTGALRFGPEQFRRLSPAQ